MVTVALLALLAGGISHVTAGGPPRWTVESDEVLRRPPIVRTKAHDTRARELAALFPAAAGVAVRFDERASSVTALGRLPYQANGVSISVGVDPGRSYSAGIRAPDDESRRGYPPLSSEQEAALRRIAKRVAARLGVHRGWSAAYVFVPQLRAADGSVARSASFIATWTEVGRHGPTFPEPNRLRISLTPFTGELRHVSLENTLRLVDRRLRLTPDEAWSIVKEFLVEQGAVRQIPHMEGKPPTTGYSPYLRDYWLPDPNQPILAYPCYQFGDPSIGLVVRIDAFDGKILALEDYGYKTIPLPELPG